MNARDRPRLRPPMEPRVGLYYTTLTHFGLTQEQTFPLTDGGDDDDGDEDAQGKRQHSVVE